jgi:hypothetical protein
MVVLLVAAYNRLVLALAAGVWVSPGRKRTLRLTAVMLGLFAILGAISGGVFNMDMRELLEYFDDVASAALNWFVRHSPDVGWAIWTPLWSTIKRSVPAIRVLQPSACQRRRVVTRTCVIAAPSWLGHGHR